MPDLGYAEKVRVCEVCFSHQSNDHTKDLSDEIGVRDEINISLKRALEQKMRMVEHFRGFLLAVESDILGSECETAVIGAYDSEATFNTLLANCEEGIKRLKESHKQETKQKNKLVSEIHLLERERQNKESHVSTLEERLRISDEELSRLRNVSSERESLQAVKEEQGRRLRDQEKTIEGLRQRCMVLEKEHKKWRESGTDTNTPSDQPSLFSWTSDSHRYNTPAPVTDTFAISYTLADGLNEPLTLTQRRRWCNCRRRCFPNSVSWCSIQ